MPADDEDGSANPCQPSYHTRHLPLQIVHPKAVHTHPGRLELILHKVPTITRLPIR